MDILTAILEALKTQTASNILTAAGIYIACPLVTHLYIQYAKATRRQAGAQKLGAWTLRGIASGGTFGLAVFVGWRLGKWPLSDAIDHALAIAIAYPLAMTVYLNWLERNQRELAQDFGELDVTELAHRDDTTEPR